MLQKQTGELPDEMVWTCGKNETRIPMKILKAQGEVSKAMRKTMEKVDGQIKRKNILITKD